MCCHLWQAKLYSSFCPVANDSAVDTSHGEQLTTLMTEILEESYYTMVRRSTADFNKFSTNRTNIRTKVDLKLGSFSESPRPLEQR